MPIDKVSSARPCARSASSSSRSARCGRRCADVLGPQAALAGLAADVHLQADLQGRQFGRALRREPLGDLQTLDAVHPVEGSRDLARLVGLQRADQVPLDARAQIGQRPHLGERLLHVVLAEGALPGVVRLAQRGRVEGLADGEQRDTFHGPIDGGAGACNTPAHFV